MAQDEPRGDRVAVLLGLLADPPEVPACRSGLVARREPPVPPLPPNPALVLRAQRTSATPEVSGRHLRAAPPFPLAGEGRDEDDCARTITRSSPARAAAVSGFLHLAMTVSFLAFGTKPAPPEPDLPAPIVVIFTAAPGPADVTAAAVSAATDAAAKDAPPVADPYPPPPAAVVDEPPQLPVPTASMPVPQPARPAAKPPDQPRRAAPKQRMAAPPADVPPVRRGHEEARPSPPQPTPPAAIPDPAAAPPAASPAVPAEPAAAAASGPSRGVAVLERIQPAYPAAALHQRIEGEVIVRVEVSEDGVPSAVSLSRSSGHASLDDAALTAVRRWRFGPAMENGRLVSRTVEIPWVFRIAK